MVQFLRNIHDESFHGLEFLQCQKMLTMLADFTGLTQCELLALQNDLLKKFLENGMMDYKRMSLDQQIAFEVSDTHLFVPLIYLDMNEI